MGVQFRDQSGATANDVIDVVAELTKSVVEEHGETLSPEARLMAAQITLLVSIFTAVDIIARKVVADG